MFHQFIRLQALAEELAEPFHSGHPARVGVREAHAPVAELTVVYVGSQDKLGVVMAPVLRNLGIQWVDDVLITFDNLKKVETE